MPTVTLALAATVLMHGAAWSEVRGDATVYSSPLGVEERCVAVAHVPGGVYSATDRAEEERLCAIDLWASSVAMCPKTWSTSPGTLIYDISSGPYANEPARFEREACPQGGRAIRSAAGELAKHKQTINTRDSSATFSTASLLYYHLSRYFDTTVKVPVAVYRSIDRELHRQRVAESGFRLTEGKSSLRMVHAGWDALLGAERDPSSYSPADELFAPDRKAIYGILILTSGDRYGSEINGTRESGWGAGQNLDFQNTAPFLALRHDGPLAEAIRDGLHEARMNPTLDRDLGADVSEVQMAHWMKELTEIVLLDFIFSQQDRVGNIDYKRVWTWVQDGSVRTAPATGSTPPSQAAGASPLLLKRTWINDNDAGGRTAYVDFAEKTQMLEKLRHFGADTYRKLLVLDADFSAGGPLYGYFRDSFGLTQSQLALMVRHTAHSASILREACRAGHLRFDLDPEGLLIRGQAVEEKASCESP
jgi:hypothetical protein